MSRPKLDVRIYHARLLDLSDSLRASYWFVPGVMALAALAAAGVTLTLDTRLGPGIIGLLHAGSPEGARNVLSVIATSMITVAGVTFSIALAAMALASSQFGPRLLRNFMRDTGNQIVLGTFLATFLYSLIVLGAVRSVDEGALFVPELSTVAAVVMTVISTLVLIYFIHHAATLIQVARIIAGVTADLRHDVDRLYPPARHGIVGAGGGASSPEPELPDLATAAVVLSDASGYVEVVDDAEVMRLADRSDLLVRLLCHPGTFVVAGDPLAAVWPASRADERAIRRVQQSFVLGPQRTEQQDVGFAIQQLVQIALRALSPAINDPFTASMCVDRLGAGLSEIVLRPEPSPYRYRNGHLRVVTPVPSFPDLLVSGFREIGRNSRTQLGLTIRLLETLTGLARRASRPADWAAICSLAADIHAGFHDEGLAESERAALDEGRSACFAACAADVPEAVSRDPGNEGSELGAPARLDQPAALGSPDEAGVR